MEMVGAIARNVVAEQPSLVNICCLMDINRIRYFSALAELQHVRRAAEVLGINSATLSRAIKVLEHEVGFKLIAPSGRGIEITDKGKTFYKQSRILLQEFAALQATVRGAETEEVRILRIGSMEVFTTYFLTKFLQSEAVTQKLRVLYLTPGKIEEALKARDIDIGITYIRLADEELDYLKVGEFRMQILGHETMKTKRWEDLPFAVPIDGLETPAVSLRSLDGWPNEEYPRQVRFELELLETALQFASIGKAVVYCPDFVGKFHNESIQPQFRLRELPLPVGFKRGKLSVYIVRRRHEGESPIIRKLAKLARSLN
jgi:DNA-binding transcriptional LysR family regulator